MQRFCGYIIFTHQSLFMPLAAWLYGLELNYGFCHKFGVAGGWYDRGSFQKKKGGLLKNSYPHSYTHQWWDNSQSTDCSQIQISIDFSIKWCLRYQFQFHVSLIPIPESRLHSNSNCKISRRFQAWKGVDSNSDSDSDSGIGIVPSLTCTGILTKQCTDSTGLDRNYSILLMLRYWGKCVFFYMQALKTTVVVKVQINGKSKKWFTLPPRLVAALHSGQNMLQEPVSNQPTVK